MSNKLIIDYVPDGIKHIGKWEFPGSLKIKSVVIPDGVETIGERAFWSCEHLTSVTIPDSVKRIGDRAFDGCITLTHINIPKNVKFIGDMAFRGIKSPKYSYPTKKLIAYKVFNVDWKNRGFQYEIGKSYHKDGKIYEDNGFRAYINPLDIFNHCCGLLTDFHFAQVEVSGEMTMYYGDIVYASDIKIIRELTASSLAEIYNSMEKL